MYQQSLTSEAIGNIQHSLCPPAAQQHTDNSLLVADFTHSRVVIDHGQQNQRVDDHLGGGEFARHDDNFVYSCVDYLRKNFDETTSFL